MDCSSGVLRVEPWALVPGVRSMGMSLFTVPKETFSPFGIAVLDYNTQQRMFVSDHGSSRVISSNVDPTLLLRSYVSYWTSPSSVYPTTLPGQIVTDKSGKDIYFPEHGGNRIAKIDVDSGQMTEYDIPTGPLSTALFIAMSEDGKKVWFTEWASNKIAYLDTTIPLPLSVQVSGYYNINNSSNNSKSVLVLKRNEPRVLDVVLKAGNNKAGSFYSTARSLLLNEVGLSLVGMIDSGITGINYTAQPQRIDMGKNSTTTSQIALQIENNENSGRSSTAMPGQYTVMVRATAFENKNNNSVVSLLYPVQIRLDIPPPSPSTQLYSQQTYHKSLFGFSSLPGILRFLALVTAIGLIAYLVYIRIKRSRHVKQQDRQQ
jgi:hypothetical protein